FGLFFGPEMCGCSSVVHGVVCLFSAGQAPSSDNLSSLSSSGSRPGREGGRMAAGSQACAKTQSPVPYPIHRYMALYSNYQLDRIELSRSVSPTMCGPTTIRLRCLHETDNAISVRLRQLFESM